MNMRATMSSQKRYETISGWVLAAPALILLALFLVGPFFMSVVLAFTNQRLISPLPTRFVGLRNFIRIFGDDTFSHAIYNNFRFALFVVPIQTALALCLALLVDRTRHGSRFFRTVYFMPVVVPMVVVSVIWFFMYNPSRGLINKFLETITFGATGQIEWLQNPTLALPAIMVLSIWQGVGFQMVIYLAGLQDIPDSLYEAARVDGAPPWKTFRHITLPGLRNTTIFVIVSTTILAFQLFDQVQVMTQGGPNNATMSTVLYIYKTGFKELNVGGASAISLVFVLVVLAVSLLQRRFLHSRSEVA